MPSAISELRRIVLKMNVAELLQYPHPHPAIVDDEAYRQTVARKALKLTVAEAVPCLYPGYVDEETYRKIAGMTLREFLGIEPEVEVVVEPDRIKLSDLPLSRRAFNCLAHAGISDVRTFLEKEPNELIQIRNCGRGTLDEMMAMQESIRSGKYNPPEQAESEHQE